MKSWFRLRTNRQEIREDRKLLVGRARRFLLAYLGSEEFEKHRFYELVAGAAAACQPAVPDPRLSNTDSSKSIAQAAFRIVNRRVRHATADSDLLQRSITDAYATVAVAYRRAAAIYVDDEEMQQVGTAAVHMVTMSNSYMASQSPDAFAVEHSWLNAKDDQVLRVQ
jgi:hypothetical protein